jgi:hypothetical protein
MPSFLRVLTLVAVTTFLPLGPGLTVSAQDRKADEPAARKGVDVLSPVDGWTRFLLIRPEGSRVEKGEMVCELDSSSLKALCVKQAITTKGAEAAVQNARLTREVAEIALKDKTAKELRSEVEKAWVDELAKKATFEREQAIEARLKQEFEVYKIVAPVGGRVRYTRPIDASTEVRKGQLLFRVVPEDEGAKSVR